MSAETLPSSRQGLPDEPSDSQRMSEDEREQEAKNRRVMREVQIVSEADKELKKATTCTVSLTG